MVLKIGYIIHEPFLRVHRAPPITSCVPPSQLAATLTVQVDNFSARRGKGNFQKAVVYGIENGRYCVVHNIRNQHLRKLLGCRTARHLFAAGDVAFAWNLRSQLLMEASLTFSTSILANSSISGLGIFSSPWRVTWLNTLPLFSVSCGTAVRPKSRN